MASPALAQVETIVVTARPPDPVGNDAFSVERIDASELRATPELDKALEQVPGLSAFRRDTCFSANPTIQGVSLRSIAPSGAGRALVTLDGVPLNDPFGGWVAWCSLPSEDLESAEVVRGAGAGPYGAGALTGTIALAEDQSTGLVVGSAQGGSSGASRVAFAGGGGDDKVSVFLSALDEHSDGWIPVDPAQRGAADDHYTLDAREASARFEVTPDSGTLIALRAAYNDEQRSSGIVDANSEQSGTLASLTIAHPETPDALGWRLQGWLHDTNLVNTSSSIAAFRASAAPSDDQYATPAHGFGFNAALRGALGWLSWEAGTDIREATGASHEHYQFTGGRFTMNRVSGGRGFVGGGYAEGAARFDGWLVTLGIRADEWASTGGSIVQSVLSTGAVTLDQNFASRSGVVPTARLGVRKQLDEFYLRAAAYGGFRAPTLNELYRPFRVGNNVTLANPDLTPEELNGVEIGGGADFGQLTFDGDVFYNQLHRAVTNVTLKSCPANFPCSLPGPGGSLIQRQNVGDIDAYGIEASAHYRPTDWLDTHVAVDGVDATVHGGTQAPQLTGKRPAEAPRWTLTGGVDAVPLEHLSVSANLRFESERFADDQNTMPLSPATTVDARIAYEFVPAWSVFVAADNLFNARVETNASVGTSTSTTAVAYTDDAPRIIRAGITFSH